MGLLGGSRNRQPKDQFPSGRGDGIYGLQRKWIQITSVRLLPHMKCSIQYATVSAALFALLLVIREMTWRSTEF
jgi:hypothetical protein